jgi:hypothetical protein
MVRLTLGRRRLGSALAELGAYRGYLHAQQPRFADQSGLGADLELGAEVGEHLHFALGANNLFDKYPNILPAHRASFAPALP